jgi:hypothetical protein
MSARLARPCPLDPQPLAVSDLARRMAGELEVAASLADECQSAMTDIIDHRLSREDLERFQGLDALSQMVGEIAAVLHRLAEEQGLGAASASVLEPVALAGLKRRLAGEAAGGDPSGEPELW